MLRRRALALTILGGWLIVLGWHVRREYFVPDSVRLLERARSLAPGTFFYSIRMNDQAIGLATTQFDTVPTGFRFSDRVILDIPALGQTHRAVTQTELHMDSLLRLQRFSYQLGSEIGQYVVRGVRQDSLLEVDLRTGGDAQKNNVRIDPDVLLDAAIAIRLAASGQLEVGRSINTLVFNPSVLAAQPIMLRVSARDTLIVPDSARYDPATQRWTVHTYDTIPVWRIAQTMGGITVHSWVDEDGHLVRAESALGYSLERTAYELADQDWKQTLAAGTLETGYGAVIERTAIAANVNLSAVGQADSLRVRLAGVELQGFDLTGGRQQLRGDTLIVRREQDAAALYTLPYRAGGEPAAELGSTPFIQSESPEIVRTAREIAGGSQDPLVVARKLNDWVHREIEKNITLSVPSAEQVLRAREGDCNEHTVLYVALARALGLPARTAVGLVHLRGRFYYHAWPEVWLGESWVAVDPTLGQFPADASHLRFLVGGLARQVELVRLIGRLQIEVI